MTTPPADVTPPAATLVGSPWAEADSQELAEVLHAERHTGTFVPTMDSCTVEGCRDEALRLAGVVTPPAEQHDDEPCLCGTGFTCMARHESEVTPPAEQRAEGGA